MRQRPIACDLTEDRLAEALLSPARRGCRPARRLHDHTDRERALRGPWRRRLGHLRHYERYASEGGCFRPIIDGFTTTTVLEDTTDRLVVHTRYLWRDRVQEGGGSGQVCRGFGERTFTLARDPDGRVVVVEMSGQQDEPAIRSLIRHVLPN
jgi:hypothetical protein